jgi:dihydrolipoamide dehydrogenase
MTKEHLVVVGAGPGGYTAAFYAADQGYKVTLLDSSEKPGGVCLHRGCIPSKALLHVAGLMTKVVQAKDWGVDFGEPKIDLKRLREWKDEISLKISGGLISLCKQRDVSFINSRGTFTDSNTIKLSNNSSLVFDRCIIATGSRPIMPQKFIDNKLFMMDSTEALKLSTIPEKMLVVGGGYIGLELGKVYSSLGSRVTIVEMRDGLLPNVDRDLIRPLQEKLSKEFEAIYLNTEIVSIRESKKLGHVTMVKATQQFDESFDSILMSVGRRPNTDKIGLECTNVQLDDKGFIKVDGKRQTADSKILAIGDVSGEPMLAHKASHEARIAIDGILGKDVSFNNKVIPAVVFTDPEVAWCGLMESDAKNNNIDVEVARFPWGASGRAHTISRTEGMTKIILEPMTKRLLGVGIVGHGAGELIGEGVLAINMGAKAEDLSNCIHPHPTLSETIMESADVSMGIATHIYKRPRK